MLKLLGKLLFIGVTISTIIYLSGIEAYITVAIIITLISIGLFAARDRKIKLQQEEMVDKVAISFIYKLFLAIFIGALWPSLPLILSGDDKS